MKKVLALVLSVLMVLSLSVVAFADEVEKPNTTPGTSVDNDPDTSYDLGFGDLGKPEGSELPAAVSLTSLAPLTAIPSWTTTRKPPLTACWSAMRLRNI